MKILITALLLFVSIGASAQNWNRFNAYGLERKISGGDTTWRFVGSGSNGTQLFNPYGGGGTADSSVFRTNANSYSLAAMQTKLNNYTLQTRSVTAGFGLIGGGNLTTDRVIYGDTTVLRSWSNSLSLSQLQTRFNLKQNLVTLTTTGTGAATFNQSTGALNIPTPSSGSAAITGTVTLTGATGALAVTIGTTMANTNYKVFLSLVSENTVGGQLRISSVANTSTTQFTINWSNAASPYPVLNWIVLPDDWTGTGGGGGGGSGTVTSVGLSSTDLSVSGSPITSSGTITANINNNAVTYAKMQQIATNSLLGRSTSGTGDIETITIGSGLNLASGVLTVSGGAGTGTINSGTANQLTYYAGTGTTVSGLTAITANRALISNASGLPVASATTNTELGYVSGITSAIQTQLNGKQGSLTLTTTGSSGAATLIGNTLNIPQYTGGGSAGYNSGDLVARIGSSPNLGIAWDSGANNKITANSTTRVFEYNAGTSTFGGHEFKVNSNVLSFKIDVNSYLTAPIYASGSTAPTTSGTKHMLTVDANGLFSHETIPSGGGSGTVNSGNINRLAWYAATGTAVSELPAITAGRVLISDANGLPVHSSVTNTTLGYLDVGSSLTTLLAAKQSTLSLTTTGSGAATLIGNTLNIPTPSGTTASGTYTPTVSNATNCSDFVLSTAHYIRIGNEVTVQGRLRLDYNGINTPTFNLSLPIPSSLSAAQELSGLGSINDGPNITVTIIGDGGNDAAYLGFTSIGAGSDFYLNYSFTYTVI